MIHEVPAVVFASDFHENACRGKFLIRFTFFVDVFLGARRSLMVWLPYARVVAASMAALVVGRKTRGKLLRHEVKFDEGFACGVVHPGNLDGVVFTGLDR